jgi:hypothetical protein
MLQRIAGSSAAPLILISLVACRSSATTCNGSSEWCDRPFHEVAQICTHNAMSSVDEGFVLPTPNQQHDVQTQLDHGVRCLMLDIYWVEDQAQLCHGVCGPWGMSPLSDTLEVISSWLDGHRSEVVSIIFQSSVSEARLLDSLSAAELASADGSPDPERPLYHHETPIGEPWPTLGEMVDSNQRLVLLTDDPEANGDWHLFWPDYAWETPYGDPSHPCKHGRGDPAKAPNQLFILNHYSLCSTGGCESESATNNTVASIVEHSQRCKNSAKHNPNGQLPTFINLDHYQVPATGLRPQAFFAMEQVNGWWSP